MPSIPFRTGCESIAQLCREHRSSKSDDPEIVLLGGGLPVVVDGNIVGAIGISGADQATDTAIGQKALQNVNPA